MEVGKKKLRRNYAKTLTKIHVQVTAIFIKQDMRGKCLPKFIEICMEKPSWCPPRWAPTWRPETNRNICHWVLLQKGEFISRGTQNWQQNNTFFYYMNFSDSQILRNKWSLFWPTWQLTRLSCKCNFMQNFRNSSAVYHENRNPFGAKFVWTVVFEFSCCNTSWK